MTNEITTERERQISAWVKAIGDLESRVDEKTRGALHQDLHLIRAPIEERRALAPTVSELLKQIPTESIYYGYAQRRIGYLDRLSNELYSLFEQNDK
ncbi:hypothetical protein J4474_03280 [Candidatus Pacearchaeota archaeon]|nr:hypothetical protein [Candidatus Pacearchaeota archaeon]